MLMQQIFAKLGVEPATKEGLYGKTQKLALSGDGTCVNFNILFLRYRYVSFS
jgi:hypothetical protein